MRRNTIKGLKLFALFVICISAHITAKTRVVFNVSGQFHYHYFWLVKPRRFVVDVNGAKQMQRRDALPGKKSIITNIRHSLYRPGIQRLVFYVSKPVSVDSFVLKSATSHSHRLVFDFSVSKPDHTARKKTIWPFSQPIKLRQASIVPVTKKRRANTTMAHVDGIPTSSVRTLRNTIIVIDPGHGGKDPGATGLQGTHEKNVVLAIARDLQKRINTQPGFNAVLTRRGDYFVSLRGRLALARRYKPDLFIAIHADAYRNHQAQGVSVFALSSRGATSEAARWLATRENQSELMGGVQLNDKSNVLKSVLINLSQTATVRASLMVGQNIISKVRHIARLHHKKVEQAAFVVLKSPDIPSLLVETGFLSNRYEERRLRSSYYQSKLANALMTGIKSYFTAHPVRNTWLAYWRDHPRKQALRYQVMKGNNLSGIAKQFRVTVSAIYSLNKMKSTQLRVGQKITIPRG